SFVLAASERIAVLAPETGEVIAVDIGTGQDLWRLALAAKEWPRAATITNGAVYFGTSSDFDGDTRPPIVYAVDVTTGQQVWRTVLDPRADLEWAPPTVQDGLVLVADTPTHPDTVTSQLHALDATTGAVRWKGDLRTDRQGFHTERPVLADGVVHTVSAAGEILSFDAADGTLLWFDALGAEMPHIAGANGGLVYVAFSDGVRAFEQRTGQRAWELSEPGNVGLGSLALDREGTLYVASGAALYALDGATGAQRWRQLQPVAKLAVVDSTLILATHNEVSAIDAESGRVLWSAATSGIAAHPVATNDVVVVATSEGDLIAFALDEQGGGSPVRVPDVRGRTLAGAEQTLRGAGLRSTPTDGDPTEPEAVVVAQEPPAGQTVRRGVTIGLRTALVDQRLCRALNELPDFSDGAHWDLSPDTLNEIAQLAGPALRADAQRVIDHIISGSDSPEQATTRALDRLVIHRRACA
ncbi:MAG: PQQ-binding-like beta-propeller repeat protein, partial [Acidimicrobiales bacterium]